MVLLSMPCPPMPMLMSRQIMDESSFVCQDNMACNSHDLLAHLVQRAANAQTCDHSHHKNRMIYQKEAMNVLNQRFDNWRLEDTDNDIPPLETSYSFFAEYTRSYIQSYMADPTKQTDIRMIPPTQVDNGSFIHCKTIDFARAQNILFGCVYEREIGSMAYPELIQLSARRMLNTATPGL